MGPTIYYFVSLVFLACANEAAFAANPDNGSTLARRWCTGCHVVSGDQIKGTDIAPSFASIAERPDFNVEKLASFLLGNKGADIFYSLRTERHVGHFGMRLKQERSEFFDVEIWSLRYRRK